MKAIVVAEHGGPEQLSHQTVPDPTPGPEQILVKVAAAGVNYIDTYHRAGLYPMDLPFTPGLEGGGVVDRVGARVDTFTVGDRVAWTHQLGSYAEYVVVDAAAAVRVPDGLDTDIAAAIMLQGLTAHYLVNDSYPLAPNDACLIHAGAGGVGRLLIQLAKRTGATVFTTVSTEEKAAMARDLGADHVINYTEASFREEVEKELGPKALSVVYDGVGAATFDDGLELIRPRGMFVLFGQSSGVVPPFDLARLNRLGSLFITRPSLGHHIATPAEYQARSQELFGLVADGELDVLVGARFALTNAIDAHRALEARLTVGKVLIQP